MGICEFKSIKIDIKNSSYIHDKKCKQNDTLILNFFILDDSIPADLTGYTCMLKANKSKKAIEIRDATIDVNKVRIQCPTSTTQFAGDLELELFFVNPITGLQKTSFTISITVEGSVIGYSDGNVSESIITPLQTLDKNLAELVGTIANAKTINSTLTSTNATASGLNSALNSTIENADTTNETLVSNTSKAKDTIEDLKLASSGYTEHIHNSDIHVTKFQKDKWDEYGARINELTNIIDNYLYLDAYVIDDDGNNVVDDDENINIV